MLVDEPDKHEVAGVCLRPSFGHDVIDHPPRIRRSLGGGILNCQARLLSSGKQIARPTPLVLVVVVVVVFLGIVVAVAAAK